MARLATHPSSRVCVIAHGITQQTSFPPPPPTPFHITHTHTSSHFDFLPALWPSLLKRDLLCVRLRTVELSPGHTVVLNSSITVRPWIISVAWRQPTNPRALHCTALTEWEKGNLKIGHGSAVPG